MPRPTIQFDEEAHKYTVDGEVFPSVTTIIEKVVPKPFSAAAWYGYRMGTDAAFEVLKPGHWAHTPADADALYELCKTTEIRPDRRLKDAGTRGTRFHEAIHKAGLMVEAVNPADFPEEDRPLVRGYAKWILTNEVEFISQEVRTASKTYRYAGTLDAYVRFHAGDHEGQTARIDWKTSKSVYPDQHFPQVAAYELAEAECGEPASDIQGVVHFTPTGRVKLHESTYTSGMWWCLWKHYQMLQGNA